MARVSTPTSPGAQLFGDKKVLIVDDEIFLRNLIKRVINQAGFLLTGEATDVPTALDALSSFKPDVLVLDINMPGETGLHLLRAIRSGSTAAARELPVVILTSLGGENILALALALDANGFVTKGEDFKQFQKRLGRSLLEPLEIREAPHYKSIDIPELSELSDLHDPEIKSSGTFSPVSISELTPGMVLSTDLLTRNRQLLLTKGSQLNDSLIKRLTDIEETFGLIFKA